MARWRVVGGQEKGLIVRSSAEVSSQQPLGGGGFLKPILAWTWRILE